ncbi:glycosyltransferase family 2 protein [Patescibacteria group bacterium]|nr:glycosyltransferase family 2 protein [Patescibacteria group bacterium]
MRVFAVIAAFREAPRVRASVEACLPYVERVIVVDDGSEDETGKEAEKGGALVLRHAINRGQGAALKTGTLAALALGADYIVHIDADGQHDPSFIPLLLKPIKEGEVDVVFGSRFMGIKTVGMPLKRRILMIGIRLFNIFALGIPSQVTDPQTGLRAFHAEAGRKLDFQQDRMAHCSEILRYVTHHLRWQEVPVQVRYSKETLAKGQWRGGALRVVWQLLVGSFRK